MRVAGLMASCHALFPLCLFRLCPVSIHLAEHYDSRSYPLMKLIPLHSPVLHAALEFCAGPTRLAQGVLLHRPLPTITLMMDVLEEGWGVICGHEMICGVWTGEQTRLHISYLELMAVFLTLKRFQSMLCSQHVLVQMDNMTVLYSLNKGGRGV